MPTNSSTPPTTKVLLGCSKCGATLPDDAEFCLKCGKSVSSPPKTTNVVEVLPPAQLPQPKGTPTFLTQKQIAAQQEYLLKNWEKAVE